MLCTVTRKGQQVFKAAHIPGAMSAEALPLWCDSISTTLMVCKLPSVVLLSPIVCLGCKVSEPPGDPCIDICGSFSHRKAWSHVGCKFQDVWLPRSLQGLAYLSDYQACLGSCFTQSNFQTGEKNPSYGLYLSLMVKYISQSFLLVF